MVPIYILKPVRRIALLFVTYVILSSGHNARASDEFNNLTCVVGLKTEQMCNIAVHKKSMVVKFPTGRTEIIKLGRISRWGYSNQSELKGFLFRWVKHRHIFAIAYSDSDNENQQLAVAFNDSQYVQPFQMFLEQVTEEK